ncbi:hypothetical protein SPLC1_S270580 [Arthrospira platensis C1]|nr:hypothetical protein SPLC1_S270580 [Arthrospira platensis C1]
MRDQRTAADSQGLCFAPNSLPKYRAGWLISGVINSLTETATFYLL